MTGSSTHRLFKLHVLGIQTPLKGLFVALDEYFNNSFRVSLVISGLDYYCGFEEEDLLFVTNREFFFVTECLLDVFEKYNIRIMIPKNYLYIKNEYTSFIGNLAEYYKVHNFRIVNSVPLIKSGQSYIQIVEEYKKSIYGTKHR